MMAYKYYPTGAWHGGIEIVRACDYYRCKRIFTATRPDKRYCSDACCSADWYNKNDVTIRARHRERYEAIKNQLKIKRCIGV